MARYNQSMLTDTSPTGFGLIGIMIVVFIMLIIVFGFQKLQPARQLQETDTSIGTYQPITPDSLPGQIEAGYQAKENAQATVKNLQDRVARDIDEKE